MSKVNSRWGAVLTPAARRLLAEFVGTASLVVVVVGSGIAAQRLSPGNLGLELLENSLATLFGLAVLILLFGPVSGAHFNPVVSAVDWLLGRGTGRGDRSGVGTTDTAGSATASTGLSGAEVLAYTGAQVLGAVVGAILANTMYSIAPISISSHSRVTPGVLIAEALATAGLIAVVFALARTGRATLSAAAVGAYIGSAYWFTSSTSFANPAVTIGRIFTDTFAGIAPGSVVPFIAAQVIGAGLGAVLVKALYPDVAANLGDVIVAHSH